MIDTIWVNGKLVEEIRFEGEDEGEPEVEDDGEEPEWDLEDDEVRAPGHHQELHL